MAGFLNRLPAFADRSSYREALHRIIEGIAEWCDTQETRSEGLQNLMAERVVEAQDMKAMLQKLQIQGDEQARFNGELMSTVEKMIQDAVGSPGPGSGMGGVRRPEFDERKLKVTP